MAEKKQSLGDKFFDKFFGKTTPGKKRKKLIKTLKKKKK